MDITRSRDRLVATVALLALTFVSLASNATATPLQSADERAEMQALLRSLRAEETSPGAGITFGDGTDDVTLSSGTANILTGAPIRSSDKLRVGSDTKMFVAAVVLQLVDEGVLDLDVPVDQYVPGVLRYPAGKVPGDPAAYDGRTVTLRQLLQHTAGIADYGADLAYVMNPLHMILVPQPQHLLNYGLRTGPTHVPGTAWSYSNTNYTLIGMIIRATTGRTIGAEIRERIVEPLGLTNTFFAEPRQRTMPGSHVRGYLTELVPLDLTNWEPAVWGTAGALVSSPDDMNTFVDALLAGEVVPPDLFVEMRDDVPMGGGAGYGLGLVRMPLSCGDAWGHSGFVAGYKTFSLGMENGRHAFITLNTSITLNLFPSAVPASATDLLELALC